MTSRPLRVGTDCSGIETPLVLLKRFGIPHVHVFSSDVDSGCRKYITKHFSPYTLYSSVYDRPNSVQLDLYVAGPPCTAASTLNRKSTEAGRDEAFAVGKNCFDFIAEAQPFAFIIENVPQLRTVRGGAVLSDWMARVPAVYDVGQQCLSERQALQLPPEPQPAVHRRNTAG